HRIVHDAGEGLAALQLAAERESQRQQAREHDWAGEGDTGRLGVRPRKESDRQDAIAVDETARRKSAQVAVESRQNALESQGARQDRDRPRATRHDSAAPLRRRAASNASRSSGVSTTMDTVAGNAALPR